MEQVRTKRPGARMMRGVIGFGACIAFVLCAPTAASAQWRVQGSEVSLTADVKGWGDGRADWREVQAAARHNTRYGVAVVRFSHVERGLLDDNRVELETYPLFKRGYLALGVGFADGANLYARSTWSAEVYANVTPQLEASVGARRMNFDDSLTMLTAALGLYHRDYLFGTRVHHALDEATHVSLSARRYFGSEAEHYIGALVAGGTAPADFRTATDLDVQASRSVTLEAQFVVSFWVLRARAEYGSEKVEGGEPSSFSSANLGVGIRF